MEYSLFRDLLTDAAWLVGGVGGGGRSKSNPPAFVRLATTGQYDNIQLYFRKTLKIYSVFYNLRRNNYLHEYKPLTVFKANLKIKTLFRLQ